MGSDEKDIRQLPIATRCPSCGSSTLMVGTGNWLVCSLIGCKDPNAINIIAAKAAVYLAEKDRLEDERIQLKAGLALLIGAINDTLKVDDVLTAASEVSQQQVELNAFKTLLKNYSSTICRMFCQRGGEDATTADHAPMCKHVQEALRVK